MAGGTEFKQAVDAFQRGDLDSARAIAERELAARPSANAEHLIGLIHCRLGRPAEGIEHLRRAAEAEPANPAFQLMLARALVDAGQASDVLAMPEPPRVSSPVSLERWRVRAEAADRLEDWNAAERAWKAVAAAASRDWRAWSNLANAVAAQQRWAEAVEALFNAVKLNSAEVQLRQTLAAALAALGRHEESLAAWTDVESVGGPTADSALGRARGLVALARFVEAEGAYREAIRLSPSRPAPYRELGLMLERTNQLDRLPPLLAEADVAGVPAAASGLLEAALALRDGRADEADTLLEAADPKEDPVRWHRLKAKIADRRGRAGEAFEAAEAMNRSTRDFNAWVERGEEYRARLRELSATLVQSADRLPRLDPPQRRMPAFLVGFPRSGTTLLDTLLMGHPRTAVLEEVHLLGAAEAEIGRASDLPNRSTDDLRRARNAYFAELDRHVDPEFDGLVIDKLPLNMIGAPFIQAMFPGAPMIFAQRHPCDCVLSGFMQAFVMNDAMASFLTITGAADLYDAMLSGWTEINAVFPINAQTVVYEKLVTEPEQQLRPLAHFLGLGWDERMLEHRSTAKERGAIMTPSYDQVTEPLTTRSSGRWRRYEKQLEPVLPILLPWAERLGYSD